MTQTVTLTTRWGRAPIPASGTPQVGYLLIEARAAAAQRAVPLNFCLVLDRSGSMQGAKLAALKEATRRIIETLNPDDIIAIVLFDDTVELLVPATPAGDRAALLDKVDAVQEAGGTAMSLGLAAGQAELRKHLSADKANALLLLTDGQTWGDEDRCRTIAAELGKDQVRITALGLGSEWNEQLLDDLADATGGTSDYIADPAQTTQFFQRALTTTQSTVATDARLLLRLARDVAPRAVHRVTPSIANLGYQPIGEREISVKLGTLASEASGSVVIDMLLPALGAGEFRIAQAELHYTPIGEEPTTIKQDILLTVTADAAQAAHDPQVMNLVERVMAFKLQTRALSEAEAGNIQGATQRLRAAATRLLDLGELDLAQKTQEQAAQLEQQGTIGADAQKELRYATRRLTQKLEEEESL